MKEKRGQVTQRRDAGGATNLLDKFEDFIEEEAKATGAAFRREKAIKTITVRLTSKDYKRLMEIQESVGDQSISEVVLRALSVLDFVVDQFDRGREIRVVDVVDAEQDEEEKRVA